MIRVKTKMRTMSGSKPRHRMLLVIIFFFVLVATTPLASRLNRSVSETSFLTTKGTWIVGDKNRPVLLRGVNLPFCLQALEGVRDCVNSHSEIDYVNVRDWGFNAVRLALTWKLIEPNEGQYNLEYLLTYVDREISFAKKYGLYVILDMHQSGWAEKWNGTGAPYWVVARYPATSAGMISSLEDFWRNETLWMNLAEAWKLVASRYSNDATVAGYDILNEPDQMSGNYSRAHTLQTTILRFYEFMVDQIRSVDTKHIIFIEPFVRIGDISSAMRFDRPNIVWSPHFYIYSLGSTNGLPYTHNNATLLRKWMDLLYSKFTLQFQRPLWIGEFGIEKRTPGSDIWTKDVVGLFAAYEVGWAWWAYYRSEGLWKDSYALLTDDGSPICYFLQYLMKPSLERCLVCHLCLSIGASVASSNASIAHRGWMGSVREQ